MAVLVKLISLQTKTCKQAAVAVQAKLVKPVNQPLAEKVVMALRPQFPAHRSHMQAAAAVAASTKLEELAALVVEVLELFTTMQAQQALQTLAAAVAVDMMLAVQVALVL